MRILKLTIVMIAMLTMGASCSSGTGMPKIDAQQLNATADDESRTAS